MKEFLIGRAVEAPKDAIAYEKQEMETDMSAFSERERTLVLKFLAGESMTPEEAESFRNARGRWWEDKYGFPYHQKAARREIILRKYGSAEEARQASELQERMFSAFQNGQPEEMEKVKREYQEKYPDQLEGIEIIFGLKDFLITGKKLEDKTQKFEREEVAKMFQSLTEFHFLMTHFVDGNGGDKRFLTVFWDALERIASSMGMSSELNVMRRGTMTQVATMKIFGKLGYKPKLSHPKEDAFNSIDLWSDETHAIQIKSTRDDEPMFLETDEIAFPGIEVGAPGERKHVNSRLYLEAAKFRTKVERYKEAAHMPDLKGYFITVPYSKIDFITGDPDEKLVAALKDKIAQGG